MTVSRFNTDPGGDCPGGLVNTPDGLECHQWNYDLSSAITTNSDGRFSKTIRDGEVFSVVVRDERRHDYKTTVAHGVDAGHHVEIVMPPGDSAVEPVSVEGS